MSFSWSKYQKHWQAVAASNEASGKSIFSAGIA